MPCSEYYDMRAATQVWVGQVRRIVSCPCAEQNNGNGMGPITFEVEQRGQVVTYDDMLVEDSERTERRRCGSLCILSHRTGDRFKRGCDTHLPRSFISPLSTSVFTHDYSKDDPNSEHRILTKPFH